MVISYMFNIFFAFFQSSVIWGNLIGSLVLSIGTESVAKTKEELNRCGANFCPWTIVSNSTADDDDADSDDYDLRLRVNILSGILLGCALGAIALVAFFVDPLDISNRYI